MYADLPSQLSSGSSLNRDAYVRNGAGNAINFAEDCGTSISGEGYALSKCLSLNTCSYLFRVSLQKN